MMHFFKKPVIKVCCISSEAEAKIAISCGADALGLVAKMPSGPGPIDDELIREIARNVPPPIATFLLTSETSVSAIIRHHHRTYTNTIQIVDKLTEGHYIEIKTQLPAIRIVQVIHVTDEASIDEAIRISEQVDALLLDSGNPNLSVKELGGTGRVHNWKHSRRIVEKCKVPVFLAGGLNECNVLKAIEEVRPFGIDLCSGVRKDGRLDKQMLDRFFEAVMK